MKTVITIEDGRVTIQVDDEAPILVKPSLLKDPVISKPQATNPPAPIVVVKPAVPVKPIEPVRPAVIPKETAPATPVRNCMFCGDDISDRHPAAVKCGKDECKKAYIKYANDKATKSRGGVPGGKRGRPVRTNLDKSPASFSYEKIPGLAENAPPAETFTRSKCCDAKAEVLGGEDEGNDGGTRHYVCLACMRACDTYEYTPPFTDDWNCGACRSIGRLCRLHHSMEVDGKRPLIRMES